MAKNKTMKELFIFPYNGNALEAIDCIINDYKLVGFIDDDKEKQGVQQNGYEVFSRDILIKYPDAQILAVPGSPETYLHRKDIIESLNIAPHRFAAVIHPRSNVSSLARIGYNTLIMAGAVVTSNAVIGNHVCILPNSVIHHDVDIGEFCLIGSKVSVASHVKIGKNCYIGSGSSIINNISIGENTLVGLGSNVITLLPANIKAAGNPARKIGII